MASTVDVRVLTRRPAPVLPFTKMAEAALPGWDISLVFVGEKRAKDLNIALRKKDYVPNVLSYESGTKSGEIVICLAIAKKQAPEYEMSYTQFVAYLFIHGLLHLKGMPHGTTMERRERAILAQLIRVPSFNATTNLNRNRHRNTPDENRRR
jgi:rRNA maturation RNase YbeY